MNSPEHTPNYNRQFTITLLIKIQFIVLLYIKNFESIFNVQQLFHPNELVIIIALSICCAPLFDGLYL